MRETDCQGYEELIGAYCDGELSRAEAGLLADHLAECSRCRQELKKIEALRDRLVLARDEFNLDPPGFAESVMKEIRGAEAPAPRFFRVRGFLRPRPRIFRPASLALAAAGFMLVVAFGSFLWWKSSSPSSRLARSQETRFTVNELVNSPEFYLYQHRSQAQMNSILPVQTADFTFGEGR